MKPYRSLIVSVLVTLITLSLSPSQLYARTWTNDKGKKITGDFVRTAGEDYVILRIKNKEHRIYIWNLSTEDRQWIQKNKDLPDVSADDSSEDTSAGEGATENKDVGKVKKKKATSPSGGADLDAILNGTALKVGKNEVLMDTSQKPFIKENKEHSKKSKIILYLPDGFDPSKQYKLMFTSASSSGKASQGGSARAFGKIGIENGWIVMTADSVNGRPPDFSLNYRLQMLDAAFDVMHKEWPASKTWKIAGAGHSGGAKAVQFLLMSLGAKPWGRHHIVGLYLSGCNQCLLDVEKRSHTAGRKEKRDVAVFMSQGKKDKIATPESSKRVMATIKKEHGMRIQRYVLHEGGHGMPREHVDEGFKWLGAHADSLPVKTIK